MMHIFWGPFCLGLFVGIVVAISLFLEFVEIKNIETEACRGEAEG